MDYFKRHVLERTTRKTRVCSVARERRHSYLPSRVRDVTCFFLIGGEKTRVPSLARKKIHTFLSSCVRDDTREDHASLPSKTRIFDCAQEKGKTARNIPFRSTVWTMEKQTYLFDESIRVIRAADGVHEARHLLHVPQPGIFTAVTALVQENRRCVGLLSRGRRGKVTCGRDHRVV